jgi:hypothetical protein
MKQTKSINMHPPQLLIDQKKEMEQFETFLRLFFTVTLAALLDWVLPIRAFVGITLFLVCADLVTGIQAAHKRGEKIHSRGLRRTVLKFTMYSIAIMGAHTMQSVFFPHFPMVFSISAYIAVSEFWSVLENVGTTTGTNVLSAIREYLEKTIGKK